MSSTSTKNNGAIMWQENTEGVPEAAILIQPYMDVISIEQEGRHINLNYESVGELCKIIKSMKQPTP